MPEDKKTWHSRADEFNFNSLSNDPWIRFPGNTWFISLHVCFSMFHTCIMYNQLLYVYIYLFNTFLYTFRYVSHYVSHFFPTSFPTFFSHIISQNFPHDSTGFPHIFLTPPQVIIPRWRKSSTPPGTTRATAPSSSSWRSRRRTWNVSRSSLATRWWDGGGGGMGRGWGGDKVWWWGKKWLGHMKDIEKCGFKFDEFWRSCWKNGRSCRASKVCGLGMMGRGFVMQTHPYHTQRLSQLDSWLMSCQAGNFEVPTFGNIWNIIYRVFHRFFWIVPPLGQVVGLRRSERDTSGGVVLSVWLGRHRLCWDGRM